MSFFAWLGRRLFGFAASPAGKETLDEVTRTARDYMDTLREERPVPLPYKAVEHQRAMAAKAVQAAKDQAYPPTCPASLPPSAPPVAMDLHVPPPETPRPLPQFERPFSRKSTGPPPPMSPPPALPTPPLPAPPGLPSVPRPPRRRR